LGVGSVNFFEAMAAVVAISDAVAGVAGGSTAADEDDNADSVAVLGPAGSAGPSDRGRAQRRSSVTPGHVAEIHGWSSRRSRI